MGIKKLSKNKYQARYFAGYNSQGKRVYPSKTFKTRKDANTWLTAKLRAKHLGEYAESSTLTLEQYLEQWYAAKKNTLKENSFHIYKETLGRYLPIDLTKQKLSAIRPHHIEQWQNALLTQVSARTVSGARTILGGVFHKAVKSRLLSTNPVSNAETVKFKRAVKGSLEPEQALAFMAHCEGVLGLCLKFMVNTGLRPEEAIAVRWRDLRLEDKGIMSVRQVIVKVPGQPWKFDTPKTWNSIRSIGFPKWLVSELKEHRKAQLEDRMKATVYKDYDLVFTNPIGEPWKQWKLRKQFHLTYKRAGLPIGHLYDLRHTFVTLRLAAGVDVKTVSEEAGHASAAFTLDHYGHVLKVMRDGAVDRMEALLNAHKTKSR